MDKNYRNWLKENFGVKGALSDFEIDALATEMEFENFDPSEHNPGKLGIFDNTISHNFFRTKASNSPIY